MMNILELNLSISLGECQKCKEVTANRVVSSRSSIRVLFTMDEKLRATL